MSQLIVLSDAYNVSEGLPLNVPMDVGIKELATLLGTDKLTARSVREQVFELWEMGHAFDRVVRFMRSCGYESKVIELEYNRCERAKEMVEMVMPLTVDEKDKIQRIKNMVMGTGHNYILTKDECLGILSSFAMDDELNALTRMASIRDLADIAGYKKQATDNIVKVIVQGGNPDKAVVGGGTDALPKADDRVKADGSEYVDYEDCGVKMNTKV